MKHVAACFLGVVSVGAVLNSPLKEAQVKGFQVEGQSPAEPARAGADYSTSIY